MVISTQINSTPEKSDDLSVLPYSDMASLEAYITVPIPTAQFTL